VSFDVDEKVKISGTKLTVIYLYVIPARVSGEWNLNLTPSAATAKPLTVRIDQRPDSLSGIVESAGTRIPLQDLKVSGEEISFSYGSGSTGIVGLRGTVKGGEMSGTVVSGTSLAKTWSAKRR
jgi:hypothetical protein